MRNSERWKRKDSVKNIVPEDKRQLEKRPHLENESFDKGLTNHQKYEGCWEVPQMMCSSASGRWEALSITTGGWWDVQRHTRKIKSCYEVPREDYGICSTTPEKWESLRSATRGRWDVQHRIRKMGGVEYYHWRMMGCTAPHQKDGRRRVLPLEDDGMYSTASERWEALSITTGGWWDVQRHTIMMGIVT